MTSTPISLGSTAAPECDRGYHPGRGRSSAGHSAPEHGDTADWPRLGTRAAMSAEHGSTVAFLFAAGDLDGERFTALQVSIGAFGGRMLDATVDSVPAVFAGPSAALACARDLLRTSGPLRLGIHCGEPFTIDDGRFFGTAVWTAARLCGRAEPSRVLVSAAAADVLPEALRRSLRPAGSVRLRGLADPVDVLEDDQEQAQPGPWADAVRVLTLLEVDQVGSTSMLDGLGDSAARTVHAALMDLIRESIDEYGGDGVEYGGDGLTVAFDSALSALDCAIAVQRAAARHRRRFPGDGLVMRAAVVSGEADPGSRDSMRDLLMSAAALVARADPDEVLVSTVTAALAADRRDHRFSPAAGREGLLLDWFPVAADRALPPGLPAPEHFVGRDRELDELLGLWSQAAVGRQQVVVLDAPPGAGKTALAGRLARLVAERSASESATVLFGRSTEVELRPLEALTDAVSDGLAGASRADLRRLLGDRAPILKAILPVVGDVLPDLRAAEVPEPARVATWSTALDAALDAMASEAPVLLVLDDLHHASPTLATALRVVAEGSSGRRLLLLGLRRPSASARAPLDAAFDDASAHGAAVVRQTLSGLDLDGTAELVAEVTGAPLEPDAVRSLLLASEGHPRFVLEFAHARLRHAARQDAHREFEELAAGPSGADVRALAGHVLQLERLRPGPISGADGTGLDPDANPYQGLSPFDEGAADRFFGRERMTAELVARVGTSPLSAVVGASGSGKSSLVSAGLLPAIARDVLPGSRSWDVIRIVPGAHPFDALASALAERFDGDPAAVLGDLHRRTLLDVVAEIRPDVDRLLLVIDQAEELFTSVAVGERDRFASMLEDAVTEPETVAAVLVLRAEFYGAWAAYPQLAELLVRNHLLVRAMTDAELRRAVEAPALRAGLSLEPALVDAVVADVAGEPGALPLLSTAMSATWARRRGRRLTLRAYAESGGVRQAVAQLADDAYGSLPGAQRPTARAMLLRLAQPGGPDEALDLRRRAPLQEVLDLGPDAAAVLRAFVDRRLVIADDATVEVAHEALLREWPLLRGWLDEDRDGRVLLQALAVDARAWQEQDRDPSLLYRGARLARAAESTAGPDVALGTAERSFLASSAADASDELRRARSSALRFRRLAVGLVVVVVLALVVAGVAVVQGRAATDNATAARAAALTAQANALSGSQEDLAGLLALAADRAHPTAAAASAVVAAANRSPDLQRVVSLGGTGATTAAISLDGRAAAAVTSGGHVAAYALQSGRRLGAFVVHGATTSSPIAVSGSGRYVAVTTGESTHVLDTRTHRVVAWSSTTTSLSFLADGTLVEVADSTEPTTTFEDPANGKALAFQPPPGIALTASSADGRTEAWSESTTNIDEKPLFTDYDSAQTHLVDVATGRQVGRPIAGLLAGESADGRLIAVIDDPKMLVISTATRKVVRTVDVGTALGTVQLIEAAPAPSVVFDAPAHIAAFEGADSGDPLHLVDIATGEQRVEPVPFAHVGSPPAFDGSGRLIALTSHGPALFQQAPLGPPRAASSGADRQEYSPTPLAFVATDPTGSRTVEVIPPATAGGPERYRITSATAPGTGAVLVPEAHRRFDDATAVFSGDGRLLAALEWTPSSDTGTDIAVWDARTGRRVATVGRLVTVPPAQQSLVLDRLAFLGDAELAAVSPLFRPDTQGLAATELDVWRLSTPAAAPIVQVGLDETAIPAFSPDGATLATLSASIVDLWSTRSGHLITTAPVPDDENDNYSDLRFSSDGRFVVAGSSSGVPAVVRWRVSTPLTPRRVTLPAVAHDHGWAISPDGSTIADVGLSGIELRSFSTGRVESQAESSSASDELLGFTRDGDGVVMWDGSALRLIDRSGDSAQLGALRSTPPTTVFDDDPDVASTRSGLITSVPTGDHVLVQAYVTTPVAAAQRVCAIAGRDLTPAEWAEYLPGVTPVPLCGGRTATTKGRS